MTPRWAEVLLLLQGIDLRVRELKKRLTLLPAERKTLNGRIVEVKAAKENAKSHLNKLELEVKQAESEIASLQGNIQKLQQQSAMVKKNNEYQAMMSEIGSVKMKIGDLESVVLEKFDEIEEAKLQLRRSEQDCDAELRSLATELAELDEFEKEIKTELEAKKSERNGYTGAVEPELLSRYNRLITRGVGSPLVPVENGICKNCNLKLTPQTLNLTKRGMVTACDNCMHIIYNPEAM